jgi:dihydrodipicolinate synthase/N-acetylneuraminate lyase
MQLSFGGLIPATVLPMTEDAQPDEAALRRYIRWIVSQGVIGVAINVDTGEAAHLTQAERLRALEVVKEELPASVILVAGIGGPFTELAKHQAREYRAAGADALLVFPIPAYLSNPLDPRIPLRYHRAIASVGLPLILFQLQPALGGVLFETDTLRELCMIDEVVAIKEASFDAKRYMDVVATVRSLDRPIALLTGNDNFIYESFVLGADGALIGFGAVMTREQVELIKLARAGRWTEANQLARRVQQLADVVFGPPVANYRARLKECLVMLGQLERATVREPLLPIAEHERRLLRVTLGQVGLLDPVAA